MWEQIVNLAISNGLFAVLFLLLLVYVLKDSKGREIKYQNTIKVLGDNLSVVKIIAREVDEIGEDIEDIKTDLAVVKNNVQKTTEIRKNKVESKSSLSENKEIAWK